MFQKHFDILILIFSDHMLAFLCFIIIYSKTTQRDSTFIVRTLQPKLKGGLESRPRKAPSAFPFSDTSSQVADRNWYYQQNQAASENDKHSSPHWCICRRLECNWSLQACSIEENLRHGAVDADGRIVLLRQVRNIPSNFGQVKEVLIEDVTPSRWTDSMLAPSVV